MVVQIEYQDVDFIRASLPAPTKRKRSAPRRLLSSSSESSDDCQEITRNMAIITSQEPETTNQPGHSKQGESEPNIQNSTRTYQQTDKLPVKMKSKVGGCTWFKFIHQQSRFGENQRIKVDNFNTMIRHFDAILSNDVVKEPRYTRSSFLVTQSGQLVESYLLAPPSPEITTVMKVRRWTNATNTKGELGRIHGLSLNRLIERYYLPCSTFLCMHEINDLFSFLRTEPNEIRALRGLLVILLSSFSACTQSMLNNPLSLPRFPPLVRRLIIRIFSRF